MAGEPPAIDLRTLATAAARGDDQAFEALHRRYEPGLLRFLARRCGGAATLAEELAGEAWVEVWRALQAGKYDPDRAAFSTFLYAVGFNVWKRHLRRVRNTPAIVAVEDEILGRYLGAVPGLSNNLLLAELIDALRGCIGQAGAPGCLERDERELVELLSAGQAERAIAAHLKLAASTVNARKKIAFEKLRRCLAEKGFVEDAERGGLGGE